MNFIPYHFHIWYKPINDVKVPKSPTVFPFTDPAFTNEYATGMSQTTLNVSMRSAFLYSGFFLPELRRMMFLSKFVKQSKNQPRGLKNERVLCNCWLLTSPS